MAKRTSLFILLLLQVIDSKALNTSFCQDLMPANGTTDETPTEELFFYPNFELKSEQVGADFVRNSFHQLSKSLDMIKTTLENIHGTSIILTDKWEWATIYTKSSSKCSDINFTSFVHNDFTHGSSSRDFYSILNRPQRAILWEEGDTDGDQSNKVFVGYTTVRGIPAAHWKECTLDEDHRSTVLNDWYVSDSRSYAMPAGKKKIILSKESTFEDGKAMESSYSMLREIPRNELLQAMGRPDDDMCTSGIITANLPEAPAYFSFVAENAHTSHTDGARTMLSLSFQTYDFENKLFIQTSKNSPRAGSYEEIESLTQVIDFNTGINYTLNLNTQQCHVSSNIANGAADIRTANGKVRMRTPDEFFNPTETSLEFLGMQNVRGFDCEVFKTRINESVSANPQVTSYTWYFVTWEQISHLGFHLWDQAVKPPRHPFDDVIQIGRGGYTLPVRLVSRSIDRTEVFDIFQYSISPQTTVPVNLDSCFRYETIKTARLMLHGNVFGVFRLIGVTKFQEHIRAALVYRSGVATPLRFADVTARPNRRNSDEIVVTFRIYPHFSRGEVAENRDKVSTPEALENIKNVVDRGMFVIHLGYVHLPAKVGSFQTVERLESEPEETTFPPTEITPTEESDSSGFSPIMVGLIAAAIVIVGLNLGILGVVLHKRCRRSPGVNAKLSMRNITSDLENYLENPSFN